MASNSTREFPSNIPSALAGNLDFECGYPIENVEGLSDYSDIICGICHLLPRNPIETFPCYHLFCKACIQQATGLVNIDQLRAKCPMCRSAIQTILPVFNRGRTSALTNIYNSLKIKCTQCWDYKAGIIELDHHEMFECPARPIKCPNPGCSVVLPAEQMISSHFQKCLYYSVYCLRCQLPVRVKQFPSHDCKQLLITALMKFYKFFDKHKKPIPYLSKNETLAKLAYNFPPIIRQRFLDSCKKDYIEEDLSASDMLMIVDDVEDEE